MLTLSLYYMGKHVKSLFLCHHCSITSWYYVVLTLSYFVILCAGTLFYLGIFLHLNLVDFPSTIFISSSKATITMSGFVMENGVTLTFECPLIREPNWRFFELFCVCDDRLCITSAWVVPWLRIYDGCTEWAWSLDGGSELWLGIMLHLWRMAVWKCEEEDKALEEEDRTR
jgi:hypothetical protein